MRGPAPRKPAAFQESEAITQGSKWDDRGILGGCERALGGAPELSWEISWLPGRNEGGWSRVFKAMLGSFGEAGGDQSEAAYVRPEKTENLRSRIRGFRHA